MPIHDQGYRRYTGRRIPPGRGWWVFARAGVIERMRERRFLALMVLAWSPFIVRALQIYASTSFAQLSFLAPGRDTFREFLDQQSPFLFFITVYAGSGLIAGDRGANALQVYLSKPLTRVQYVLGKLLVLTVFLLAASWLPAMALLVLQVIFAGSSDFIRDNPSLVPAITLFCAIEVLATSLAMLALSSLSTSRRFVAVIYAGAVVFAAAVYQVLRGITGTSSAWAWVSPENVFDALGIAIFRAPANPPLSATAAITAVAAIAALSIFILDRRVRPLDAVT
jgi:ABC-2 type transport system permease protein